MIKVQFVGMETKDKLQFYGVRYFNLFSFHHKKLLWDRHVMERTEVNVEF